MNSRIQDRNAMSLLELLVVVGIIAILMVLALPAWTSISGGMYLTSAADNLGDAITLARQEAITKNRRTRVSFFTANGSMGWQILAEEMSGNGTVASVPIRRKESLPNNVAFWMNASPLLGGNLTFAGSGRPEGLGNANNYISLRPVNPPTDPPPNFITIQVNPINGRISKYQP